MISEHTESKYKSSHHTGILSTSTVTSTEHVFCDSAVEGLTAVAFFCGDDGERDGAEGGGDLASAGTGVSPAGHSTHSALRYGGALPRQQSDGDVAVQVDRGLQLGEVVDSVIRDNKFSHRGTTPTVCVLYLYKHNVIVVGGVVVLRVGHQKLGQDLLFCALIDGQRVVPCHYHHSV